MTLQIDQKLFEACLVPVLKPAYGIAYYLFQDEETAEELIQAAVLRAFFRSSHYVPGTSFAAWFLKTVIEVLLERQQQEVGLFLLGRGNAPEETGLPDETSCAATLSPRQDAFGPLLASLTEPQIAAAFAQLPEPVRLIVAIHFMGELSYQQIADILDCPVGEVRLSLHHGRWMLYRLLYAAAGHKNSRGAYPVAQRSG